MADSEPCVTTSQVRQVVTNIYSRNITACCSSGMCISYLDNISYFFNTSFCLGPDVHFLVSYSLGLSAESCNCYPEIHKRYVVLKENAYTVLEKIYNRLWNFYVYV